MKVSVTKIKDEYRCGVDDCRALFFKGIIDTGHIEPKCGKCGTVNIVLGEKQKATMAAPKIVEVGRPAPAPQRR